MPPRESGWPRPSQTIVAEPVPVRLLVWVGFPLLGAAAGWLLKAGADWLVSLPWVPLPGWFRLLASLPEPKGTIGVLVVGGLAGLTLAHLAAQERLTVTVSADRVTLARPGSVGQIERGQVSTAFLDGKRLVLLGRAAEELAREASDLDASRLRDAFQAHGYAWAAGGDPYQYEFRRWVEDLPDLPAGANALFKARQRALDKGNHDDVAELRAELAKLGIVVREEKKRQYWRRSGQRPEAPRNSVTSG
jgi:hypothetical protein